MTLNAGRCPTVAQVERMLRTNLPSALLFASAMLTGFVAASGVSTPPGSLEAQAPSAVASAGPLAPPLPAPPEEVAEPAPQPRIVREGRIGSGGTLASALAALAVGPAAVDLIAREMAPVFDFRYAHADDRFRIEQAADGSVLAFRYERSPFERYGLERTEGGWAASRHEPRFERRQSRLAGLVSTSLYEAIEALGERAELANDFASIFAWDVDFARGVQPGDAFSLVYERLYIAGEAGEDEVYVRPGRILAARYTNGSGEYRAVYFQRDERRGGYYRPDGSSVERQFLRAPLKYSRISSVFSLSRMHPILKIRRPHEGIDYAAPTGTPVWNVADGEVIFRGRAGGYGKLVKVRHNNGYVSYYGHLSRFDDAIRVGTRVAQKQVLGYVGATGLATGPHLDFRIRKNDRFVNPAKLSPPAGDPITPESRPAFAATRDELLAALDPPTLVVVSEAL
jgi:murein DD-endopeptidase MepM/ murein hydrolase activator NlpD